jgi:flagellar protein FlaF
MGFSVSGSAAIVFAGMFVAFGMFYTATANTAEQVSEANADWQDGALAQQNTAIEITSATHYVGNDSLVIRVNNTGAVGLSVEETDLLVDNEYQTAFSERSVEGDASTSLWLPGQTLRYNVSTASQPSRVKLVTETGVAGTEVVQSG